MAAKGKRPENVDFGALVSVDRAGAARALVEAGPRADELVDAWVRANNIGAVAAIADGAAGPGRKAARRGLNVLRSRGATIPEPERVASVATRGAEQIMAWMMAPDPSGLALFVIGARAPAGRYRAAIVEASPYGVLQARSASMAQSELKELFADLARQASRPIEVPVDWARSKIADAKKRGDELRRTAPLALEAMEDLVGPAPEGAVDHPLDGEGLVVDDDDARELAKSSNELHALPEFRRWLPPRASIDELLREVGKSFRPGKEPAPELVLERVQEEVAAATDRYFGPDTREALVRTMKDSAVSVLANHGEARALEVVATMCCVARAGLITDPPREVPFLRAFFQKGIAAIASERQGQLSIPIPSLPVDSPSELDAPEESPMEVTDS